MFTLKVGCVGQELHMNSVEYKMILYEIRECSSIISHFVCLHEDELTKTNTHFQQLLKTKAFTVKRQHLKDVQIPNYNILLVVFQQLLVT